MELPTSQHTPTRENQGTVSVHGSLGTGVFSVTPARHCEFNVPPDPRGSTSPCLRHASWRAATSARATAPTCSAHYNVSRLNIPLLGPIGQLVLTVSGSVSITERLTPWCESPRIELDCTNAGFTERGLVIPQGPHQQRHQFQTRIWTRNWSHSCTSNLTPSPQRPGSHL